MACPPSFNYFPGDHVKSCTAMSAEVFGAFWRLQLYQFEHGSIPTFPDERARVAGVDLARWDMVWSRMASRFHPMDDSGGLGHPRMAETRAKEFAGWNSSKETARKRSKAGRLGGSKKTDPLKQGKNDEAKRKQNASKSEANLEEGRGKREGLDLEKRHRFFEQIYGGLEQPSYSDRLDDWFHHAEHASKGRFTLNQARMHAEQCSRRKSDASKCLERSIADGHWSKLAWDKIDEQEGEKYDELPFSSH